MPDSYRATLPRGRLRAGDSQQPLTAAVRVVTPEAVSIDRYARQDLFSYDSRQTEGWAFYHSLGEFNNGVTWRANALSRVRLMAAELTPGGDEPEPVTEGAAADLVAAIGGGIVGAAKLMYAWAVHLDVPGKCWTVAEDDPALDGRQRWRVVSTQDMRQSAQPWRDPGTGQPVRKEVVDPATGRTREVAVSPFEVRVSEQQWRPVDPTASIVFEVSEPDPEHSWQTDPASRAALPIMRRIDLYDRAITSILLSRVAMNGFLKIANEIQFPARPEYKDQPDPFTAEMYDFAAKNIKNPGSAGAALPFPVRIPAQYFDQFEHLTTSDGVSQDLLDARHTELERLATTLRIATERLTGQSDVNHWGLWELSEEEIKFSVAPLAETICDALTRGYLQPALAGKGGKITGPNGGELIIWYDTSELSVSTDRFSQATQANEDLVISDEARRREIGLDEADAPDKDELSRQILRQWTKIPELAPLAYFNLTGHTLDQPPADGTGNPPTPAGSRPTPSSAPTNGGERAPPGTRDTTGSQVRERARATARETVRALSGPLGDQLAAHLARLVPHPAPPGADAQAATKVNGYHRGARRRGARRRR